MFLEGNIVMETFALLKLEGKSWEMRVDLSAHSVLSMFSVRREKHRYSCSCPTSVHQLPPGGRPGALA